MMFFSVTTIEESKSTEDSVLGYLHSAWRDGDVYLQLSALGLAVFVLLCCLICLAWMHYGSVISTVFDARNKVPVQSQFSKDEFDDIPITRSSSYFAPRSDGTLSTPGTRKIEPVNKKRN